MFSQQLVNGLVLGSIYSLIALGYTLVYGILMMINFAHSEVFMVGAFLGLGACALFGHVGGGWVSVVGVFVLAMAGGGLLGVLIERLAYRPLRHAMRLIPLISAIGVSIMLSNSVFLWISNQSLPFPQIIAGHPIALGNFELNSLQLLIFTISIVLMIGLSLFIKHSKVGKAMRACADDIATAGLMGINANKIIAITFLIGGALAAAAGVLNGVYYGTIKYNIGFLVGVKAFTAAVLGGIGNIAGAVLGGFVLGIIEVMAAGYLPDGNQWKDVVAFVVLIGVLLLRPSGLLGEKIAEKV